MDAQGQQRKGRSLRDTPVELPWFARWARTELNNIHFYTMENTELFKLYASSFGSYGRRESHV